MPQTIGADFLDWKQGKQPQVQPQDIGSEFLQWKSKEVEPEPEPESFTDLLQFQQAGYQTPSAEQPQPIERPPAGMPTMGPMTPALERKQQEFAAKPQMPGYTPEGVVVSEGARWTERPGLQRVSEKVAERAPMFLISPTAGIMFEGITQAKNIIVPLVEKSKYDPTAQSMLVELLPEDTAPWLRTALTTGEMGVDMLIAGFGLRKAAEAPGKILKDTFKHIYRKARAKGYSQEQLDKVKALADKYIKPSTIKEEVARNIKARKGEVPVARGKRIGEPTEPLPSELKPKPVEPGKTITLDANDPRIIMPSTRLKPEQVDQGRLNRALKNKKIRQTPIRAFLKDDGNLQVVDGAHRLMATRELGEQIKIRVEPHIEETAGKEATQFKPSDKRGELFPEEKPRGAPKLKTHEELRLQTEFPTRPVPEKPRKPAKIIKEYPEGYIEEQNRLIMEEKLREAEKQPSPKVEWPTKQEGLIDTYYDDVVTDLKKQKQSGFVKITPKDKKAKFSDKQVEKALSTSRFPQTEVEAIKEKGRRIKESGKKVFVYEPTLKEHPKFKNDVRLFQDVPWDAFLDAQKKTLATVGKLNKIDYNNFAEWVGLKSFESDLNEGLTVAYDLTLTQVEKALVEMEPHITPGMRESMERHINIVELEHQDLVARGKIDPERGKNFYLPHIVMEYNPAWTSWRGMPRKFQKPFREYLVRRKGSKKPIEMNYINAMTDHYTKVFLDNAIDDFMESSVKKWDIAGGMSKEDKKLNFGKEGQPQPRLVYEIKGKKYQGFQFEKGKVLYPAKTVNEKLWQQAVAENLTVAEFTEMRGPKGSQPIKESLALGKKHKVSVLPQAIAERLEKFRSPMGDLPGFWAMRDFMSWWKRMTLDFAGLPFQVQNFLGDSLNLFKTDPAAFSKYGESLQIMLKQAYKPGWLTSKQKELLKTAQEQRVTTTHMFRETGLGGLESRKLKQLRTTWNPVNWVGEIFYQIEKFSMTREGIARLAKYFKDLELIQQGKMVVSGEVDITGLEPISAAGKVSREFTVDYGAVSQPYKRFLRGVLAPFLTFYDYNARNWFKYFAKHPIKSALKFGVPTVALWTWNNTGDRAEIEKDLGFWRYIPHVITGYKTKEGKPIVVALQTPFDMALSFFGLDKIPAKITDIKNGKMTWGEAALQQLKDTALGGPEVAYRLLNPFIQGLVGLATNRDPYTRKEVVPSRFKGTKYEKNFIGEYIVSKVLTPYAQYMRIANEMEYTPEMGKFGAWLLKGPVDALRAFGIRKVDLDQNKMLEGYEAKAELTSEVTNKLAIAERAWVKAFLMPDEKEAEAYLREAWKKLSAMEGPNPTNEQLVNRLYHNRTQIEIITRLVQQTKDPDLREEMKKYLTMLKQQRYTESMGKYSIKAIRPQLFKSLGEIHK